MRDYRRLEVWRNTQVFVVEVYRATAPFPKDERFGLTSQLRRAAVSIASNIAEGAGRESRADYARFLDMALGSANECEAQILISRELGFLADDSGQLLSSVNVVRRQLVRLRARIIEKM